MSKSIAMRIKENSTDHSTLSPFDYPIFDSHFHIIEPKFPLFENNGYLPKPFTHQDYLKKTSHYQLKGGAIVSGSFQKFDQSYLVNALTHLGSQFVGVTQVPNSITNDEIIQLNSQGIKAVRFNLKRGGSEDIKHLVSLASRIYEIAGWHVELYVDSAHLGDLTRTLVNLPSVSIDHLGLSAAGFKILCGLVEKDVKVKATGFSRVDFDVAKAIKRLHSINSAALMFGTDLPSTRAAKAYSDDDLKLIVDALDDQALKAVLYENAMHFYRIAESLTSRV